MDTAEKVDAAVIEIGEYTLGNGTLALSIAQGIADKINKAHRAGQTILLCAPGEDNLAITKADVQAHGQAAVLRVFEMGSTVAIYVYSWESIAIR